MAESCDLLTTGIMRKATVTAATSEATGHPIENALDFNPDTYWSPTSTAAQTIDIDMGEVVTVDQFAILIHDYNTDYEHGTHAIAVRTDDNDDGNYTATSVFGSAVWNNTVGDPVYLPFASPTPTAKRYWRIYNANADTQTIQISGFLFLRKRSISVGNQWPEPDPQVFSSRVLSGPGGRRYATAFNSRSIRELHRNWLLSGDTNLTALLNAFEDCMGPVFPLILTEGSNNYFVNFQNDKIERNQQDYQIYNPSVVFIQRPMIADGEAF